MLRSDMQHNNISQVPHSDDKQEIAALWQEVFHDSDNFVELFFNRVYKSENTLVIKRDNRIISALQMVPYQIKIDHKTFPSAYICSDLSERIKIFLYLWEITILKYLMLNFNLFMRRLTICLCVALCIMTVFSSCNTVIKEYSVDGWVTKYFDSQWNLTKKEITTGTQ